MATRQNSFLMPDLSKPARRTFRAGGFRTTFFAVLFMVLLPFFVSLPAMLYQRFSHGVWLETWGLMVIAIAFTVVMLLILCELLNSILARVELGESGVRIVLPYRRALLPTMFYRKHEIPYNQMHLIETRREVYGGLLAPVMMYGARIIDKNGDVCSLGYVSEADIDPLFPVRDIVEDISKRANIKVVDKGAVRRQASRKLLGLVADPNEAPISEADVDRLNRRHKGFMYSLIGLMTVLIALGVRTDFLSTDIDRGERARDAVVRSVEPPVATKAK